MSHSIHHVPGRLRVRSTAFRCQPGNARTVQQRLNTMDGVKEVKLNAAAGSLTIHYDPQRLTHKALLEVMQDVGCTQQAPSAHANLHPTLARKAGAAFGKALVGAAINKVFERSAFKLVSVLL